MIGKKTLLHDWHAAHNAQFMDYGGWQLPLMYGKSFEAEYASLRNGVGLIDLCHDARYRIEGEHATTFLDHLVTIDLNSMDVRQTKSAFLCNERGGIVDQVTIYRDQSYYLLIGNGPGRLATLDWLDQHAQAKSDWDVKITDVTTAQGQIHMIGPAAKTLLNQAIFGNDQPLEPGFAIISTIDNARCLIIHRMTEGFDLITGSVYIQPIWEKLANVVEKMGSRPIGFTARDILRVETGLPMYGSEMDSDTTPIEIGLGGAIDFRKKRFEGRRALMHSVSAEFQRQMVAVQIDMESPSSIGAEIVADGFPLGKLTSIAVSPVMRCKIGLGFVSSIKAKPGTTVTLRNGDGVTYRGTIMKPGQLTGPR